jgi:hypothetical protein
MIRGVEQRQLDWLITNRSQVRVLPPQPRTDPEKERFCESALFYFRALLELDS